MAFRSAAGASRPGAHRPPTRRDRRSHFPDLGPKHRPSPTTPRVVHDELTGRRYEVRELPPRLGSPAVKRFELTTPGRRPEVVSALADYPECTCEVYRRAWECNHVRILVGLDLVDPACFALVSDAAWSGKGVGDGR